MFNSAILICSFTFIMVFQLLNCEKSLKPFPFDLLNTCLDSENHKSEPGPEASLFNLVSVVRLGNKINIQILFVNFSANHGKAILAALQKPALKFNIQTCTISLTTTAKNKLGKKCLMNVVGILIKTCAFSNANQILVLGKLQ